MQRVDTALLLIAAVASGCAPLPTRLSRQAQVEQALTSAATQVRRCYRAPRVPTSGRQIITRLRVRLTAEGELVGLPVLIWQAGVTSDNAAAARPMAEAAIAAVMRCVPLRLPPELHAGWRVFDLTFSPLGVA